MKHDGPRSRLSLLRHTAVGLVATVSVVACSVTDGQPGPEPLATTSSAVFANGGFETGGNGAAPPSWTVNRYLNKGITAQTPQTVAGLNLQNGGVANTVILTAAGGPGSQNDQAIGNLLTWPRYGNQCAIVNGPNTANQYTKGANENVNELSQTMTVGASDVDPLDGKVHVRFAVAPVLMNPAHTATEQPYYMVVLTNLTQGTTLYSDFNLSGAGIPWQTTTVNGNLIDYTGWQLVDIAQGMSMGDQVMLQIYASGCSLGAHWGEIYVDGVGPTVPGLAVQGTGPADANAGANITYTLTYRNGSPQTACTTSANCAPNTEACVSNFCAETNVVLDFTTPPNTTFQSFTPPVGATCTTPAVGSAGTITCTFTNPVSPGASGTFTVTVAIAGTATGQIDCAAYDIRSTQETPLDGPPIVTNIGCTADAQCGTGQWCDETSKDCDPTLANGQPMPSDPAHMNPTLNGTCTAGAATLVCTSSVCDVNNNECGYENGDGPCTTASGAVVCDSGVCDGADDKCGYANGDGPCTSSNGGVVCRSSVCSANGKCMASGTCNVDADCTGGDWCEETTHTCTPKLPNGQSLPNDPAHTNPTLNGMCTMQAGALVCVSGVCDPTNSECGYVNGNGPCMPGNGVVCQSGVCDPDGKCGYANGDGPCTMGNAGTVCRSGTCSSNGDCEPSSGCNVDADCTGGDWCDESTHACMPKLPNGQSIPNDPAHMNPTLNGTCNAAAGSLVCTSGVCDSNDNECGYANGDGPCTMQNGGTVCRSGVCSSNGNCEPSSGCNVDADCTGGDWCDESTHACMPKLPNGQAIPNDPVHMNPTLNGMCTTAAGSLVCTSGVCDSSDNECGYANGDGPCTMQNGGTVCRSGMCDMNGTCGGPDAGAPDAGFDAGSKLDAGADAQQPDASTPAEAGSDAAAPSDASTGSDASEMADSTTSPEATPESGFIEGGGLSCAMGPPSGEPPFAIGAFAVMAFLASRRRSRSTARSRSNGH